MIQRPCENLGYHDYVPARSKAPVIEQSVEQIGARTTK